MNCPVCGQDQFSFCIAGTHRVIHCQLTMEAFATIDILTRGELAEEDETPPFLVLTCRNCKATLFKDPQTPLMEAWKRYCVTACPPRKWEPRL